MNAPAAHVALAARVEALEQFVHDIGDLSETLKLLVAQHAREFETVISALADQIKERGAALAPIDEPKAH